MIENIEKVVREYIPNIIHMSLATSKDNKPWVTEVHFTYDNDLNFYFKSRITTRHCLEIKENKFVAGNIVTQHTGEEKPRGVYFEGTCLQVEDPEDVKTAIGTYNERFGINNESMEAKNRDDGHRFFKITVEKFYVFDAKESTPSHKYELNWNK